VARPDALASGFCDPSQDLGALGTWRAMSTVGAPKLPQRALWTGAEMVIMNSSPGLEGPSLTAYDPTLDRWRRIPVTESGVFARGSPFVGVVGHELFVFGGAARSPPHG
jgi:hypothetical protein